MSLHVTRSDIKEQVLEAVITRADGTVENLGPIAYYHKNPWTNFITNLAIWFKAQKRKFWK